MLTGLDDPGALDSRRVGAKAARLAQARLAGISVLPGVVIDVACSLPVLAAAVRVAAGRGRAAGQLAVMERELPAGLAAAVRERVGCDRLVVRSSSPVEESGAWSGAFASYTDVAPDELETAIRGCWSSMLGRDAVARFEQTGRDPAATGMAVLVQQAITPSPGGVAHVVGDTVHITVAEDGQLAALLQGWHSGRRAELARHGRPDGPAIGAYGLPLLECVADLARACQARTGAGHLEWGFAGERCYVLQARRADSRRPRRRHTATLAGGPLAGGPFVPIARAVARFGGAVGDELVLPWCFAPGGLVAEHDGTSGVPARPAECAGRSGLAALRRAAGALTARAWRTGEEEAAELARSALARLRDRHDPQAAATLRALAPVDALDGRRVVAAVEQAAAAAVAAGHLFDVADAWRLPPALLDQLLAGALGQPGPRPAATGWEPFLAEVARASGRVAGGEPAAAGLGAGRLLVLGRPQRLAGVRERWVLHVAEPLAAYAPLLWGAAGLVCATGSASAHLFDVARTLAVPAVAGVVLPPGRDTAPVVAVDGSAGQVFVL